MPASTLLRSSVAFQSSGPALCNVPSGLARSGRRRPGSEPRVMIRQHTDRRTESESHGDVREGMVTYGAQVFLLIDECGRLRLAVSRGKR